MKKIIALILSFTLLIGFTATSNVSAKSDVKNYKNCKALNADYKGGVARSASAKNKGGKTKFKPFVSKELYDANKKLDRDKDEIACER